MRNYLERLNRMPEAWDSGSVDVGGPSSSTDNAVVRWDGTGARTLQNSVVTISDVGAVAGVTTLSASGNVTMTGATASLLVGTSTDTVSAGRSSVIINGTTGGILRLKVADSEVGSLYASTGEVTLFATTGAYMRFLADGTEKMRLFANGNFAIGTTTDNSAKLQVSGNLSATQIFAIGDSGGGLASTISFTNANSTSISTGVCSIFSGGTTARSNTGWYKFYVGTAARYIPYFTDISG